MIAYDTKERRDRILNEYALRGEEPRYIKVYDPGKDDWVYILKEPKDIRRGVQ